MTDTAATTTAGRSAALGGLAAEKLNQLRRLFEDAPRGGAGMPTPQQVAEELFHRAPSDYIERVGIEQMAKIADALIALPGGRGTDDMIRRAKSHGLTVYQMDLNGDLREIEEGGLFR